MSPNYDICEILHLGAQLVIVLAQLQRNPSFSFNTVLKIWVQLGMLHRSCEPLVKSLALMANVWSLTYVANACDVGVLLVCG